MADETATIRLRPQAAAAHVADNWVRSLCAQRGLSDEVVRDAAFVAGELVAISVRQVRAPLDLDMCIEHGCITIRVRDLGAGRLAQSRPNGVGTSRSMQLVHCLAQAWGVSVTDEGRAIWARIT